MTALEFSVEGHRLAVAAIPDLGAVDLAAFRSGEERLVVLVPPDVLLDDGGLGHYSFHRANRGRLASVRVDDLAAAALDLAMPADTVANTLRTHNVRVACMEVGPELTAATVLVACGLDAGEACAVVRRQSPDALGVPAEEVAVSVAAEHIAALRDLHHRRLAAVRAGRSPWEVR